MAQNESAMAIIQASAFYDQDFGPKHGHIYGLSARAGPVYRNPESPEKVAKNFTLSNSSTVSSPSSTNSNGAAGLGFPPATAAAYAAAVAEEGQPEFGNFVHVSAGSLLCFDQSKRAGAQQRCLNPNPNPNPKMIGDDDDYPMWDGEHDFHSAAAPPETSSSHHHAAAAEQWGWLNDHEGSGVTNGEEEAGNNKRPCTGENLQAAKKQCVSASKKAKPKSPAESKDPQSVAAKNRRERISERLKILQELVPNGSKVDLVTMLEKAISYVKFLQLQVKVLATDEFWPAQGGKAPDLSQVREAIDAILASQRDRKSSSK